MPDPKISGAYLDELPITQQEDVVWGLTAGVQPYQTSILMSPEDAVTTLRAARVRMNSSNPFFTLHLVDDRNVSRIYKNIVVTGYEPYSDAYWVRINIADSRIFWHTGNFKGDFNIKVKTGEKRIVRRADEGTTLAKINLDSSNEYWYRTFSLYPPQRDANGTVPVTPWKPSQIIDRWVSKMQAYFKFPIKNVTPALVFKDLDGKDVRYEDIQVDGPFDDAMSQIKQHFPQLDLFLTADGDIKFFNRYDMREFDALNLMDPEWEDHGHVDLVTYELVTPDEIEVLYTTEAELKFEVLIDDAGTVVPQQKEGRWLEPLIEVPDLEITDTTVTPPQVRIGGEYMPFQDYLTSLGAISTTGIVITEANLRNFYVMGSMLEKYGNLGKFDFNVDWVARVGALKRDYSQLWKMNKRYFDRMVNPTAEILSIVNPIERQRLSSPVYVDYSIWLGERGRFADGGGSIIVNVDGFANDSMLLSGAKACPVAKVSPSDLEIGIFRIDFHQDPLNHFQAVFPRKVENAPTFYMDDRSKPRTWDEGAFNDKSLKPQLSSKHRLATIISASPAPNLDTELYKITVNLKDIKDPLVKERVKNAKGVKVQIRVPASEATIRIAWTDETAEETDALFGVGPKDRKPDFKKLKILNAEIMNDHAIARATEYWSYLGSRLKGTMASNFAPNVEVAGTMLGVHQRVTASEGIYTELSFADELNPPHYDRYVSRESRAFLLQQVNKDIKK